MRQWWILRVSSKVDVLWQLRMLPSSLIRSSCLSHGFFLVTNHKVDGDLIQLAYDHVDHFLNLPIEEKIKDGPDSIVANYFEFTIGKDFKETWLVYQKYSEAMHGLELLAIGLGVDRMLYREFFEDAVSIMRTNLYPTCQEPIFRLERDLIVILVVRKQRRFSYKSD
ncbi:hypothetical protein L3X38_007452 [Prunus dulcis]|uniref:Non-haem dioxygenase N-terminal domain-containing protein n=1 Tax=Prunus dulcis TaxID=3755 RepID=A0AAD5F602_PRUDU|nr:hypothetical protein L3X38_007452 [Prunus dulcis]